MVDKNKLKMEGLKFGRLLQSVYRLSAMFTVEHRAADGAVKQSYEALNLLVKVVNQFTFGFLDHRVLLNNILTPDKSLRILENEFSKRGLGAVTFPAGLTMGGYRRLLSIICASPDEIQQHGGIKRYFEQNQVEGVRVIPGQKGTSSMEETVLEGDPESLMAAQNAAALEGQGGAFGLDLLLEAVGMGGGGAGGGGEGPGGGGTGGDSGGGAGGSGVPGPGGPGGTAGWGGIGGARSNPASVGIPGASGGGLGTGYAGAGPRGGGIGPGSGGSGMGPGVAGPGGGSGYGTGFGPGAGTGSGTGVSAAAAPVAGEVASGGLGGVIPQGTGESGLGGDGTGSGGDSTAAHVGAEAGSAGVEAVLAGMTRGSGFAKVAAAAATSTPSQVLGLAHKAITRSFSSAAADPVQALNALSRMLEEFKPEVLMPALSPEKQKELQGKPAREVAADLMEDVTAQWAAGQLAAAKGEMVPLTEEQVIRVIQRSTDATQTVERMLTKLSRLFEKANLPTEFYSRIQQELRWAGLGQDEKRKALLELQRYNANEFKRLLAFVKDAVSRGAFEDAQEAVSHYFAILDLTEGELQPAELARGPELLQAVARLQTLEFMRKMADRLSAALVDEHLRGWFHLHIAACLSMVAHSMAPYEAFDTVQKIAVDLESSRQRNPQAHRECCSEALGNLLGPRSIERLIELYAQKKEAQKMVLSIVKYMGNAGVEKVFQRLEEEKKASNRMALIRLLGQMGPAATVVARQRLNDDRWYVVRNACFVLSDLRDPELLKELRPVLSHADERVQQAAFNVMQKMQTPGRAAALADSLPKLKPHVLDVALDELRFWKSPDGVPGLEKFVVESAAKPLQKEKAMHALLAVPEDGAIEALARILLNQSNPTLIRRMAIAKLGKSMDPAAYESLTEVASRAPKDPLASESQSALEIEM